MLRLFNHYVSIHNLLLAATDVVVLSVSISAALFLRWADISEPIGAIDTHLPGAALFVIVFSTMMFAVGLYRREAWRSWITMVARVTVGFSLALVVVALFMYFLPSLTIWRSSLVIATGLAAVGTVAVRLLYSLITDFEWIKRRIVVLGTGEQAARIEALEREGNGRSFFACVGYIRVNGAGAQVPGPRLIKGVNNLPDYILRRRIDEIVVATENQRDGLPFEALLECEGHGVAITDYLTFYERETGRVDLSALHLGGLHPTWAAGGIHPSWLTFSGAQGGSPSYRMLKRGFDTAVSLAFLVFMLPLLLATAIAIRLDSSGPIFYRQERIGSGGQRFMLLKFRSMVADAEADGVPKWADPDDPRVTRVGSFIRRTRIDEIPQMTNVLLGDMSLVGPRPERPFFVERLAPMIPFYGERHRIKPGITGWAQINYQYAASTEDTRIKTEFDLYYIKNQGIFLDLLIVLQTLRVVIWPQNVH